MSRLSVSCLLPLSSATLLLASPAHAAGSAADFDNVVVIIVDDVGTDKVGAYAADVDNSGEDRPDTPNIDMLAAAGVRFTDAWAAPMCSPTRAMVYSGEYAHRNGVGAVIGEGSGDPRLPTTPTTLPQLAGDSGVKSALIGKWHAGETATTLDAPGSNYKKEYPVTAGFSYFAGNMDGEVTDYQNWLYMVSKPSSSGSSGYTTTAATTTASETETITDAAIAWMDAQDAAQARHFTVVSYGLPHATRNASGAWTWQDAATECGGVATADEKTNFEMATECVDSELGLLFAGIPDLDHTLVVFMGDNGTEKQLAEGHFADGRGKSTVYESGVRVPLVIADGAALAATLDNGGVLPAAGSWRIGAGETVSDPSSVVDLYATVADFLALSSATCTIGSNCARDSLTMRPLLTGAGPARDETWTETFSKASNGKYTGSAALRFGDHKLVVRVTSATSPCRKYELYDVAADRWETTDLANDAAHADEKATLIGLLDTHAAVMADTSQAKVNWLPTAVCTR